MTIALEGILIGIAATILMDAWALVLKSVFGLPTSNWGMVGRWAGHLPRGRFMHASIHDALPVAGEHALGWATHYLIGILYGAGYLFVIVQVLERTPSLLSAVAFSLALLVAPWFILQPALGLGVFARRAPKPWLMRTISVSMHLVFGIGMYVGWRLIA